MGKSLKWGWLAAALVCAGSAMAAGKSGKVDAAQIGANREAVSRALSALRQQGIATAQRGHLVMHDPDALMG